VCGVCVGVCGCVCGCVWVDVCVGGYVGVYRYVCVVDVCACVVWVVCMWVHSEEVGITVYMLYVVHKHVPSKGGLQSLSLCYQLECIR